MTHTILKYEPEPQEGQMSRSEFIANCFSEFSDGDYILARQFGPDDFIWVTTENDNHFGGILVKLSKKDALAFANWIIEKFN
jgi:hypothetical protein